MRFRSSNYGVSLLWTCLATAEIVIQSLRLQSHRLAHQTGWEVADVIGISCWVLVAVLHSWMLIWSHAELTEEGLRANRGWRMTAFPYNTIVGIRSATTDSGRRIRNGVELEVASRGPEIYPHQYIVIKVVDPYTFSRELHKRAPHAEYEVFDQGKLKSSLA